MVNETISFTGFLYCLSAQLHFMKWEAFFHITNTDVITYYTRQEL